MNILATSLIFCGLSNAGEKASKVSIIALFLLCLELSFEGEVLISAIGINLVSTFNFKKHIWSCPSEYKDLNGYDEIAIDLETCDPNIKDTGPGWAVGNGYIAGVAIAVEGWKGYFPIRHEGGGNFDERILKKQVQRIMDLPCDKVFHNAAYDVGWLRWWGVEVKGKIICSRLVS